MTSDLKRIEKHVFGIFEEELLKQFIVSLIILEV